MTGRTDPAYQQALEQARKKWWDGDVPPEITAVAAVTSLDPDRLWDYVEGVRGWESHDPGYEDVVWESALHLRGLDGDQPVAGT